MRVFVTGAAGWVGSAVVKDLIAHGHQPIGLARSEANVAALTAAGIASHRGSLEDVESLVAGANAADAVVHCAFNHDFSKIVQNCADEKRALEAMGAALAGTGKMLVITSGTALLSPACWRRRTCRRRPSPAISRASRSSRRSTPSPSAAR